MAARGALRRPSGLWRVLRWHLERQHDRVRRKRRKILVELVNVAQIGSANADRVKQQVTAGNRGGVLIKYISYMLSLIFFLKE